MGCDAFRHLAKYMMGIFQSTHPHGVRLFFNGLLMSRQDFNPRTRMGCDFELLIVVCTRTDFNPRTRMGCDLQLSSSSPPLLISIHAPAWGATQLLLSGCHFLKISIHAPAWGATSPCPSSVPFLLYFNPRTRMGCDLKLPHQRLKNRQFQSTHPHGVRHVRSPANKP